MMVNKENVKKFIPSEKNPRGKKCRTIFSPAKRFYFFFQCCYIIVRVVLLSSSFILLLLQNF